jgi:hypothetical protein
MFKRRVGPGAHAVHMGTMIQTLAADGPFPGLADELRTFGQFIGAWDVDLSVPRPDGTFAQLRGEWHFGWALGGRAIVDVFKAPGRDHGLVVRFYDPDRRAWRVSYSGPVMRRQILFVGHEHAGEIVLEGEEDGTRLRWIFSDITSTSFTWRALESVDGGRSWELALEVGVTRRG